MGGKTGRWIVGAKSKRAHQWDLITLNASLYSWQSIGGPSIDLMGKGNSAGKFSLECDIKLPLDSSSSLQNLLQKMQPVFKHNYIAGELVLLELIIVTP